jgi:hypothetical protein
LGDGLIESIATGPIQRSKIDVEGLVTFYDRFAGEDQ